MTFPSYPTPSTGAFPSPVVQPPATVKGAFLTYLVAALLSLIGIVFTLTSNIWDQAIAAAQDRVGTSSLSAESLVTIAKTTTLVAGVVFLALYLLFAFKMRAGRNWARIVLTVLSGLSIVSQFSASSSVTVNGRVFSETSTQISGWIGAILGVVAIVLMYMTASNRYFAESKAARG